jgi:hypothetical protein
MTSNDVSSRRRTLLKLGSMAIAVTALPQTASAQVRLEENDPQAVALGYRHDTTKVDKAKWPKHSADQKCSNCQLYTGKPTDATAPCSLFGNKLVAGNGWCSVWTKRAA